MRKYLLSLVLIPAILMSVSKPVFAGAFDKNGQDSVSAKRAHIPASAFWSLDFGSGNINTSGSFSNWLMNKGYGVNNGYRFTNGMGIIDFKGNWMMDFGEHYEYYGTSGNVESDNFTIGAGYKLLKTNIFTAYGGLNLGLNTFSITPNQALFNDFSRYNQPSSSSFTQYALLLNPHILLYRDITNNLTLKPDRISAIDVGLDFGYNVAILQSKWLYGYSNPKPFTAVPVSGIPSSAWDGFYIMLKVGWHMGQQ